MFTCAQLLTALAPAALLAVAAARHPLPGGDAGYLVGSRQSLSNDLAGQSPCIGCLPPEEQDIVFYPNPNHNCAWSVTADATATITGGVCSGSPPHCEPISGCPTSVTYSVSADAECLEQICVLFPTTYPSTMCAGTIVNGYCCTGQVFFGTITNHQTWTGNMACGGNTVQYFDVYSSAPTVYSPGEYLGRFEIGISCGSCPQ